VKLDIELPPELVDQLRREAREAGAAARAKRSRPAARWHR